MASLTMSARTTTGPHATLNGVFPSLGRTARGRPPSPLIGANVVWAVHLVAFGSMLIQHWVCG